MKRLVRENIQKMTAYSSARSEFKGSASIFLDANENPFNSSVNRYPDPLQWVLKEQIAKIKGCQKEQILLGNGSDEVLDLLFRAFCEPKEDHIITLPPTYGMYQVLAELNNVNNQQIPLNENFEINTSAVQTAINTKTKLLFICSPNNPTGNTLNRQSIEQLLGNKNLIVVIDEAYIDFSKEESWVTKLNQYPNLVVCQTLSKAWGAAGIRLGMCFASTEIIDVLNKIKPPYNINSLTQKYASNLLDNQQSYDQKRTTVLDERARLEKVFQSFDFIKKIYPSDANFILIKVENAAHLYQHLVQKGIIVRNRSTQLNCENCIRISIGTPDENTQLLAALTTYI